MGAASQVHPAVRGLGEGVACGFDFLRLLDVCLDVVDAFVFFALGKPEYPPSLSDLGLFFPVEHKTLDEGR